MDSQKPKWWRLYLTVPLIVIGMALVVRMGLPPALEQVGASVVIILGFGLMLLWMRGNQEKIEWEEYAEARRAARQSLRPDMHSLPSELQRPTTRLNPVEHPQSGFGSARTVPRVSQTTELVSTEPAELQR